MPGAPAAIVVDQLTKTYARGRREVIALNALSLTVPRGEFLSVMGPSGSGKSTLLNLIGGLDVPSSGDIYVEGLRVSEMSDDAVTTLRRTSIGVVFQFFNLLPSISAFENVALPLNAAGMSHREITARVMSALGRVGLVERSSHLPDEMSGGEMQRVAIARALVIDPTIILADEPTGNLDSRAAAETMAFFRGCNREHGVTIILVTHSPIAAAYGDRIVTLRDGGVADEVITRPTKPPPRLHPVS